MAGTDFDFDLIRDEVKLYEAKSEAWRLAHRSAMRCRDLEARLALGVFTFNQISRADEHWRKEIYAGNLPFADEDERAILDAYRTWAGTCDLYLKAIAELESQHYAVEHAEEFRQCTREVRGILTSDENFFSGEQLTVLRDEAIEAHRKGATEEITELDE
jgi:hypothetical protein